MARNRSVYWLLLFFLYERYLYTNIPWNVASEMIITEHSLSYRFQKDVQQMRVINYYIQE